MGKTISSNLNTSKLLFLLGGAASAVVGYAAAPTPVASVRWYSDLVFQSINVMKPVKEQMAWRTVLTTSWGKNSAFPMNDKTSVSSCQQLFLANSTRLHVWTKLQDEESEKELHQPVNTQRATAAAYVVASIACYAARDILHATAPKVSYLANFEMNARDAHNLPAALFQVMSDSETVDIKKAMIAGKTLGEVVGPGSSFEDRANKFGNAPLVRVDNGFGAIEDISLLARGDFNHDGIEDLLISISATSPDGHFGSNQLYLVTRLAPDAPMKVLKTYPDLGLGIPLFQ